MADDSHEAGGDGLRVAAMGGGPGWRTAETVIADLPRAPGFAVIALAQDNDVARIVAGLSARAQVPVVIARDELDLAVDHVYIVPNGHDATVAGRRLRLVPPGDGQSARLDRTLRSLADELGHDAIAVVLHGDGHDGGLGVKRVKESGGLVVVEAPEARSGDGSQRVASTTAGIADLVVPARDIAPRLVELVGRDAIGAAAARMADRLDADAVRDILTLVRIRSGHDFMTYKRGTLARRIARRMQVCRCDGPSEYLTHLRDHPDEQTSLLRDLLISVTNFFRDPAAFARLGEQVVPALFADKHGRDQVRVWIAGCATGEEAYSVAMLLADYAAHLDDPPVIQIFATDIDTDSLADARAGRYPETIAADVPARQLERYFVRDGAYHRVRPELREMVLFSPQNLLRDPPFSRLDLITCRNVLIYLNRDAQHRVLQLFHFALRPDGYLMLGLSETADGLPSLYAPVDVGQRIYRRRPASIAGGIDALVAASRWHGVPPAPIPPDDHRDRGPIAGELHQRVVERFAPPSVLVDDDLEIVHLSEHAGRFLTVAGGEPTRQLLRLVLPALRLDLRTALYSARQSDTGKVTRVVRFAHDGVDRAVEIGVQILAPADGGRGGALVSFAERPLDGAGTPPAADADPSIEPVLHQLEIELARTRDQLRVTVEQYETTVEELKTANEELQAINEELRSTTEERESGKEELQSINEELTTVNHELSGKVDELSRANTDLQNLIASTDIGVVFLDRDLRIKRFTERACDVFNVIPTDVGRPLAHVTHRLDTDDLSASAAEVLRTLRTTEREVHAKDGRRYLARLLPYRSFDDRIDGVVLTLVNTTELGRVEAALRDRDAMLKLAERAAGAGLWVLDVDRRELRMTDECLRLHGLSGHGPITLPALRDRVFGLDRDRFDATVRGAIESGDDLDLEYRVIVDAGYRWVWTVGRALRAASDGPPVMISGITVDITAGSPSQRPRDR